MGRAEYSNDPAAPKANTLIPASNLLVVDDKGAILLQRRRDTGPWALLPEGAQDIGETAAQCAVRECLEETGLVAEITGFLGVCTNPNHIVAYTDGEIRLQYENTNIGRPVGGEPTINDEADGVCFVQPDDLDQYDIRPSMHQQIGDYFERCESQRSMTASTSLDLVIEETTTALKNCDWPVRNRGLGQIELDWSSDSLVMGDSGTEIALLTEPGFTPETR